MAVCKCCSCLIVFFFQAEDGIRDLVRSRGLGDVYKRQAANQAIAQVLVAIRKILSSQAHPAATFSERGV